MCNSIFLDGVLVDRLRFALSIEMWSCRERWYHGWELGYLVKDKVLHVDSLSRSASCIRMFVNAFAVFVSPVSLLGLATIRWMCKTAGLY
jgi:hypothetical protein